MRHQLKVEEPGGVQSPGQSLAWCGAVSAMTVAGREGRSQLLDLVCVA